MTSQISVDAGSDAGPQLSITTEHEDTDRPAIYTDGTLVLVGCGKAKRDPTDPVDRHAAADHIERMSGQHLRDGGWYWRAEDLYTSTYFQAKRAFAETVTRWQSGDPDTTPWAILSAEHALLFPWETVQPYDTTIADLGDDPLDPADRVTALGQRRPDGQEVVTEMDQWATLVAAGLSRWLAMHREAGGLPYTTDATTLLVLAGQEYIKPLRERGVFQYGAARTTGDPNDYRELDVGVRYLFEEIHADGIGEQMAWLSDAISAFDEVQERGEQQTLAAPDGGER